MELDPIFKLEDLVKLAFDTAKDKIKDKNNQGDEFVNRFEFRLLLIFLKQYFLNLKKFIEFDKGLNGQMDLEEFKKYMEKVNPEQNAEELFL